MFPCKLKFFRKLHALPKRYSQKPPVAKTSSVKWQSVVGLEVHAQIASVSKLFSRSSTEFARPVNTNVALLDCSTPGTLPVLNKRCVEAGVITALALNCKVNPISMFDRKHYFYGDLPSGYQITQQRSPLANSGFLQFEVYTPGVHKSPYTSRARIKQVQLEQDSGKSLHEEDRSLVDLNRAGVPLMEIVFEPDLSDGEEAAALVKELVGILQRIQTCSCKMEEGALRVDANVSINRTGDPLGVRTEVKNIGSVRGVAGAIKYEIERQIAVLEAGGRVTNETRNWDAISKTTLPMRDKEQYQDYRYMPEPNLPPLFLSMGGVNQGVVSVDELHSKIPELPEKTRQNLKENLGLTPTQAIILVNEYLLLKMFEDVIASKKIDPKLVANILINDFLTIIHKEKIDLEKVKIDRKNFGELIELLQRDVINRNTAKMVLKEIVLGNTASPEKIVADNNWAQISDTTEIRKICKEIIENNPKLVAQYKSGKVKILKALLGIVATKTAQRINMVAVEIIMKELVIK